MIIVIDGPAGSGKSSTARAVANRLGIEYLDSGALYRAVTLIYLQAEGQESEVDIESFFSRLDDREITFMYKDERFRIRIDGRDVTDRLRSLPVTEKVSEIAARPEARAFVNDLMREAVRNGHYIAEGRDLGTAVFPEADLKFFMSATLEERARRRYLELKEAGIETSVDEIEKNIAKRDRKDTARKADPLKVAEDAIEIDTTRLDFEQQVQQICWKITNELDVSRKGTEE